LHRLLAEVSLDAPATIAIIRGSAKLALEVRPESRA